MKTIEINLYKFNELSEEAQQKALENLWDLNVDHEWWEFTYEDANNIGLNITEFDLYRGNINGYFGLDARNAAICILKEHGKGCETYILAENFIAELHKLEDNAPKDEDGYYEDEDELDQEIEDLGQDLLKDLLTEYLSILDSEYNYLTSEKAIVEGIKSNEYDFTENGELY